MCFVVDVWFVAHRAASSIVVRTAVVVLLERASLSTVIDLHLYRRAAARP
jgi:hypothetical protein